MSAIIVLAGHYVMVFFRALYLGDPSIKHFQSNIEYRLYASPLYTLVNASFVVHMFWIITAFLISYSWFNSDNNKGAISRKLVSKYTKFVGPILISVLFSYAIAKLGWYFNSDIASYIPGTERYQEVYNFIPSILAAIKDAIFDTFFRQNSTYNRVLWTMGYELYGSFLTITILHIFGDVRRRRLIYSALVVIFFFSNPIYLCFILGVIIGDVYTKCKKKYNRAIITVCFFSGIIFGAFPPASSPVGICGYINNVLGKLSFVTTHYYNLGAALILFAILHSSVLDRVLSNKFFLWIGKYSLYIYLFHQPFEFSFSMFLFKKLYSVSIDYLTAAALTIVISWLFILLIVIIVKYICEKYMFPLSSKFTNWLVDNPKTRGSHLH